MRLWAASSWFQGIEGPPQHWRGVRLDKASGPLVAAARCCARHGLPGASVKLFHCMERIDGSLHAALCILFVRHGTPAVNIAKTVLRSAP
jgi:hypothetical protein